MLRNIRQGYRAWARIGTVKILCRPGAGLSEPRNLDIPYPLHNSEAEIDMAEGLHYPNVSLPLIPMTQWWTASNINGWFHTRGTNPEASSEPFYDDLATIMNGASTDSILFQESKQALNSTKNFGQRIVYKAKGGGYSLSFSKGEPIGFNAQFGGVASDYHHVGATYDEEDFPESGRPTGTPLNFSAVTFGGCLSGQGIIGGSLEVNTGLTPNPELDYDTGDTDYDGDAASAGDNVGIGPKCLNAGLLTAMLTVQTNAGAPIAGNILGDPGFPNSSDPAGTITIGGVTWNLWRVTELNPYDRQQMAGRIVRTWRYKVMGREISNAVGPCVTVS